jgi:phage FluMu gp28-like protein
LEHMPPFKADLEDGMLDDIPKDDEIRDDLLAIKKIKGVPKVPEAKSQKKSADGKKLQRHGDGAIALFLANYAMSKPAQVIEHTPMPSKDSRWNSEDADEFAPDGAW